MNNTIPAGDNSLLKETVSERKISWLERFLGPENYRIVKGLVKTPASILGFTLIFLFILVAIFAPVIAPPVNKDPLQDSQRRFFCRTKTHGFWFGKRMFLIFLFGIMH